MNERVDQNSYTSLTTKLGIASVPALNLIFSFFACINNILNCNRGNINIDRVQEIDPAIGVRESSISSVKKRSKLVGNSLGFSENTIRITLKPEWYWYFRNTLLGTNECPKIRWVNIDIMFSLTHKCVKLSTNLNLNQSSQRIKFVTIKVRFVYLEALECFLLFKFT